MSITYCDLLLPTPFDLGCSWLHGMAGRNIEFQMGSEHSSSSRASVCTAYEMRVVKMSRSSSRLMTSLKSGWIFSRSFSSS